MVEIYRKRTINMGIKKKATINATWLMATKIYQMLLSLVVSSLSARYLGPENYGTLGYASAYIAFFTAFCKMGMDTTLVHDFSERTEEGGKIMGTALILRTIVSALSIISIYTLIAIIEPTNRSLQIIALLQSFTLLFEMYEIVTYWFNSDLQAMYTSIAAMLAYTASGVWRIILLINGATVEWFAASGAISDLAALLFVLVILFVKYPRLKLSFSWKEMLYLLKRSYHFILSGIAVSIYGSLDKIMLKQDGGVYAVGLYASAMTVACLWEFVPKAIITTASPIIYKKHESEGDAYKNYLKSLILGISLLSIAVSCGFLIFGNLVVNILFGKDYMESLPALLILIWSTGFTQLNSVRAIWAMIEDRYQYGKYFMFMGAALDVVLNLLLIPVWHITGACIATLITQIFVAIVAPMLFKNTRPYSKLIIESFSTSQIRELAKLILNKSWKKMKS